MTYQILRQLADGKPHSGEALAKTAQISRTAVWKQIENLRKQGLMVDAQPGRGYQTQSVLELLNGDAIYPVLTELSAKRINRISILPETNSTNDWVKQQPEPGVIAVVAEHQNNGRGRRGNYWACPPAAGILLSLKWPLSSGISALRLLSLQCGLAVAKALEATTGFGMQLKWPNDILYEQKKIAGILVEINGTADSDCVLVIGVGINVHWPQPALLEIQRQIQKQDPHAWLPGDCGAAGQPVSRNLLAAAVLNELVSVLTEIESGQFQVEQLLKEWHKRDVLLGKAVLVTTADKSLHGKACGLSSSGALRLQLADDMLEFHGSDASIRLLDTASMMV